jgi:hypothetical protein
MMDLQSHVIGDVRDRIHVRPLRCRPCRIVFIGRGPFRLATPNARCLNAYGNVRTSCPSRMISNPATTLCVLLLARASYAGKRADDQSSGANRTWHGPGFRLWWAWKNGAWDELVRALIRMMAQVNRDDGLGLDDHERRSPAGPDAPDAREQAPEPTVRLRKLQPLRPSSLQHPVVRAETPVFRAGARRAIAPMLAGLGGQPRHDRPEAYPSSTYINGRNKNSLFSRHSFYWLQILNNQHLERVLDAFMEHYNGNRPDWALALTPPR